MSDQHSAFIDKFLLHKEINEGRSPRTSDKYRRYLIKLERFLGDTPLCDVTRDRLIDFTGMHAHKELNLSPSARKPLISSVRMFYAWLTSTGEIVEDPAADIPYPKSGRPLPVAMQLSNAEKILMGPDLGTFIGVRDLAILSVLLGCGPRVSGVCRLNESDLIFYKDDEVEHLAIRFVEKGKRERILPAPLDTLLMLRAYMGHHELDDIDRSIDGDKVLFVSTRNRSIPDHEYNGENRRIHAKTIDRLIKRYGSAAGIPCDQLSAHSFRHLFGTELAEDDVTTIIMQSLMGHADPKTSEIYAHLAMRKLRAVVSKSNPLAKIKSPVSGLRNIIGK